MLSMEVRRALTYAGATAQMILAADEADELEKAAKRAYERERKARYRASKACPRDVPPMSPGQPSPETRAHTYAGGYKQTNSYYPKTEINNLGCVVVLRRPMDKNAELTPEYRDAAKERGLNNDTTQDEFKKFKSFNLMRGTAFADWLEVWRRWLTRVEQPKEQPVRSPETDDQRLSRLRAERLAREAA